MNDRFRGGEELLGGQDEPPEGQPRRTSGGRGGRGPGGDPGREGSRGETSKRILFALPWIAFTIAIIVLGGPAFAAAMVAIGALCMRELFTVTGERRETAVAGYAALAAICLAAELGGSFQVLLVLMASVPFAFALRLLASAERAGLASSMAVALLAILWIALPLAHGIELRNLPEHGAALVVNVLIGTFVSDTSAYATGRMLGHRRIFPGISPSKTVEGLIGGFVIGALSVWFAGLYQDWLSGVDALILGVAVAAAAPLGDLFESSLKRDLGVKDTGTIFGPHGGLLDRVDAALFTIVVGYYASVALVY